MRRVSERLGRAFRRLVPSAPSSLTSRLPRIKGYSPDEIIGHHFSNFYTEDDKAIGLPATALDVA
jgi:hypothetical protein